MPVTTEKQIVHDVHLDTKKLIFRLISYWWVFLIFLAISIASGQLYLRYATFEYSAKAKLLIKGVGNSGALSELGILSEGLGIAGSTKDLSNEIQILTSRPIVKKTIEKIGADVTYFRIGNIKDAELYTASPILLDSFDLVDNDAELTFFIRMGYYQDFDFMLEIDGPSSKHTFGQPFTNNFGTFSIIQNKNVTLVPGLYQINILSLERVAEKYKRKIQVEVVGSEFSSSILELKLQDNSSEKAVDIVNTLIETYNEAEISDATQILSNTIKFIDVRIENLSRELGEVEGEIEKFKIENRIITEDASSSLDFALTELRSSLALKNSYEVEEDLLLSLRKNLISSNTEQLIPTHIGNSSPALANLIQEHNQTFLQRKRLMETVTEESPVIMTLSSKLSDLKELIIVSIEESRKNLQIPASKTNEKIKELRSDITNIPSFEKELIEKLRMQGIKESLFLFLLEKREEIALSSAITEANTRIIERAKSSGYPVFPQSKLILLGSIILGLAIPTILLIIINMFKTTIDSEETLTELTSIPIIGRIFSIKSENKIIAKEGNRSINQETFRLLRSNLSYLNLDVKNPVIMVTSSVSGEGKTVITLNMGLTIAMAGKKTIVIDLDLRKPKVNHYLNGRNTKGITNFITGRCSLKEIINSYEESEYFNYISSGPIPPNPAELLQSQKMNELIKELKKEYDFIIIDSPPVGLVADSLSLRQYLTNTIYVVRHKYSKRMMIKHLEELHQQGHFIKPSLVMNDIKISKREYGYGGYASAYESGYFNDEQ